MQGAVLCKMQQKNQNFVSSVEDRNGPVGHTSLFFTPMFCIIHIKNFIFLLFLPFLWVILRNISWGQVFSYSFSGHLVVNCASTFSRLIFVFILFRDIVYKIVWFCIPGSNTARFLRSSFITSLPKKAKSANLSVLSARRFSKPYISSSFKHHSWSQVRIYMHHRSFVWMPISTILLKPCKQKLNYAITF